MSIKEKYKRRSPQKGEAGFTLIELVMVIVIASILGIFIFGTITNCLVAQRDIQLRKEKSDDAIRTMDKVNRELREAANIVYAGDNMLKIEKNMTSSQDSNLFVQYIRDDATDRLLRQSAGSWMALWPTVYTWGDVIATNITQFYPQEPTMSVLWIQLDFEDGNYWETYLLPRNVN